MPNNFIHPICTHTHLARMRKGKVKDEWHYMSQTFNELLDRLQDSFNLQKRFISNASHELSTPLTSITSQIEVSLQRERVAEEYKAVMKSIHQDVLHMAKLTQMLLQLAKASENPGGLELSPVRIDDVIFRIPAEMGKVNKSYSVSFNLEELPAEEERLLVFGNEELLCAAIKNIVANACKYSANNLALIKLVATNNEIILSVHDTGSGIPQEKLAQIFEPFFRADEGSVKEGFGLGLSLASRIIKLHKGDIKVISKVGEGTLFSITLPVAKLVVKQF